MSKNEPNAAIDDNELEAQLQEGGKTLLLLKDGKKYFEIESNELNEELRLIGKNLEVAIGWLEEVLSPKSPKDLSLNERAGLTKFKQILEQKKQIVEEDTKPELRWNTMLKLNRNVEKYLSDNTPFTKKIVIIIKELFETLINSLRSFRPTRKQDLLPPSSLSLSEKHKQTLHKSMENMAYDLGKDEMKKAVQEYIKQNTPIQDHTTSNSPYLTSTVESVVASSHSEVQPIELKDDKTATPRDQTPLPLKPDFKEEAQKIGKNINKPQNKSADHQPLSIVPKNKGQNMTF